MSSGRTRISKTIVLPYHRGYGLDESKIAVVVADFGWASNEPNGEVRTAITWLKDGVTLSELEKHPMIPSSAISFDGTTYHKSIDCLAALISHLSK
jgi:hypothetical protein